MLRELLNLSAPGSLDRNPIRTWQLLAESDTVAYCPFAYGYSNYSRHGYASHQLTTGNLITLDNGTPLRSTLGGAGIAVSAQCKHRDAAIAYAAHVASPLTQRTLYVSSGGQPGHRAAWLDAEANRITNNFFANTLPTLDAAWVRPRWPGFIAFPGRRIRHRSQLSARQRRHRAASASRPRRRTHKTQGALCMKPLEGLLVIDFSQFLSGPSASLRSGRHGRARHQDRAPRSRRSLPPTLHLEPDARWRLNALPLHQPQQRKLRRRPEKSRRQRRASSSCCAAQT